MSKYLKIPVDETVDVKIFVIFSKRIDQRFRHLINMKHIQQHNEYATYSAI